MDPLILTEKPQLSDATLVVGMAGWADAGGVSSVGVRYLRRKLGAHRFGELDPEEFYDFSQLRPQVVLEEGHQRRVVWPINRFYYWQGDPGPHLIFFSGVEPHLKWRTYCDAVIGLAQECGAVRFMAVGGTYDSIPHTVTPQVSGSATDPDTRALLSEMGVGFSSYQGPTSIHSALMEACRRRDMATASLWGHAPHYIQAVPNPRVCHAVLGRLARVLGVDLALDDLLEAATTLDRQVERVLTSNDELRTYVHGLEEAYGRGAPAEKPAAPEDSAAIVRELEEFLRRQRGSGGTPPSPPIT